MHFPDEIWTMITDLKRHKPLRIALDKILSDVVISEDRRHDSVTFCNGRFSYERFFLNDGLVHTFFYSSLTDWGYTNYFPYSSEDLSVFYTFGIGLVVLQ